MANPTELSGRSSIQIKINSAQTDTAKLAKTLDDLNLNVGVNWAFGTGANEANLLYHATLTATSSQATVDISDSGILDVYADACSFKGLKLLYIKNTHATVTLILGGDTNEINLFTDAADEILVPPGGYLLWIDPSAAGLDVSGDDKNLTIQGSGNDVTYDIVLMGLKS